MGRTARQKQQIRFGGPASPNYTRKKMMGPSGPVMVVPSRLPLGMKEVKLSVPMRIATCAEVGCRIFTNDRIDPVTQKVIPAGSKFCGAMHKVWNGKPVIYLVKYGGTDQVVFMDEHQFVDELGNGIYSVNEILKRGSYDSNPNMEKLIASNK